MASKWYGSVGVKAALITMSGAIVVALIYVFGNPPKPELEVEVIRIISTNNKGPYEIEFVVRNGGELGANITQAVFVAKSVHFDFYAKPENDVAIANFGNDFMSYEEELMSHLPNSYTYSGGDLGAVTQEGHKVFADLSEEIKKDSSSRFRVKLNADSLNTINKVKYAKWVLEPQLNTSKNVLLGKDIEIIFN